MLLIKILPAAAVGGAILALGGQVRAQSQELEVKLSGQINRSIMHADDGVQSGVFHVDNENSSTRFRLTGSFRSVLQGRGVETTSFTGWQTTGFPG